MWEIPRLSELKVSCRTFVKAMKTNRKLKVPTQIMSLKALNLIDEKSSKGAFLELIAFAFVSNNEVPL